MAKTMQRRLLLSGSRIFVPLIIYGWLFFSIWLFNAQPSTIFFASLVEIWVLVIFMVVLRFFEAGWNLKNLGFEKMFVVFSLRSPNLAVLAMATSLLSVFQLILLGVFIAPSGEERIGFADYLWSLVGNTIGWVILIAVIAYGLAVWKEDGFNKKNTLLEQSFILEIVVFFFMNLAAVGLTALVSHQAMWVVLTMIAVRFLVGVLWNGKKALA
jgi:hypothetical protein